jgi:enoyl-CoA hydratase
MIHVDQRDDITVVRLQHGKANALDLELCQHLHATFDELAAQARAVVLTGRGGIFSAGVDLLRVLDGGPAYVEQFIGALSGFCEAIFTFPKPLVAAVNGHAIAGGCVIACMADRRLMAQGPGRIGVPELLVGVPFPAAPLEAMRFVVPPQHFGEVIYGGATYEPTAAMERGLVDEVVQREELLDRAVQAAASLAALAPPAFQLTKAQIRRPAVERMRVGAAEHDAAVREVWATPDTLTAIRDYVSRTFKRSET